MINKTPKKTLFIENLTFASGLFYLSPYLISHKNSIKNEVFYIDCTKAGLLLTKAICRVINLELKELTFRLIDIRDESGVLIRERLPYFDFKKVQDSLVSNEAFQLLKNQVSLNKIFPIYLIKRVFSCDLPSDSSILWRPLFLIQVVAWKIKNENEVLLFMNERVWMNEINDYALKCNIKIIPIKDFKFDLKSFAKYILRGSYPIVRDFCLDFSKKGFRTFHDNFASYIQRSSFEQENDKQTMLAVQYYGQLNLDNPELHSDLFFWQQSKLPGDNILLMFHIPSDPLDENKWKEIKKHNMHAIVLDARAKSFSKAAVFYHRDSSAKTSTLKINFDHADNSSEIKWVRQEMLSYEKDYNYWVDLFEKNRIKIYVSWYKYDASHCIIADALKSLGGITAIYQRSFEEFPSPEVITTADVVFSFSKKCAEIERKANSIIPYHITVGFLGDHRFVLLKKPAEEFREKLRRNGATRIVAYFDENSIEDSRWHVGNQFHRENYLFLLEKVLSTPWLGLLIKPKTPCTLRKRLRKAAELLKAAEETGRCFVFEGGALHSPHPPALAALAADIAIHGHLAGATPGQESALAGVPTLLLDREGWPVSFLNKLGKGKVVFDSWEALWSACQNHWTIPGGIPGFGEWTLLLDDLDPFRDGRAAERMGTYLKWMLDGLKARLPRETVLADAAERYAKIWGKDKVVNVEENSIFDLEGIEK